MPKGKSGRIGRRGMSAIEPYNKREVFRQVAYETSDLKVLTPEEQEIRMLKVVQFLDRPTPEEALKIDEFLSRKGALGLAEEYRQLYDEAVRLESSLPVERIDEVPELLDSLIDTLSEKKSVLSRMKDALSQMGRGIMQKYFNKKERETDATLKKYLGALTTTLTTWASEKIDNLQDYVNVLLDTLMEGDSSAVNVRLSELSLRLRQWATLQKIYNTGLPTMMFSAILNTLATVWTSIINTITNVILGPASPYFEAALGVFYNVSVYLLEGIASINTGGFIGDTSAGSDIAALVLLCSIIFTMVRAKYPHPGGGDEATLRAKLDAFYDYLSSNISDLKTWCSRVPGRVSEVITKVFTYIQQTEVFKQVTGGFDLSVYILTGIPLNIFSHFVVGTREALYASIAKLKEVYEAGEKEKDEAVRLVHIAEANRQAAAIMAQIPAAEQEAAQAAAEQAAEQAAAEQEASLVAAATQPRDDDPDVLGGGARKSKSRRRRGPTVNKKQKKSRRYKRSNNRGGSRKSKKATKKRRN